jgi:hypothetical protein
VSTSGVNNKYLHQASFDCLIFLRTFVLLTTFLYYHDSPLVTTIVHPRFHVLYVPVLSSCHPVTLATSSASSQMSPSARGQRSGHLICRVPFVRKINVMGKRHSRRQAGGIRLTIWRQNGYLDFLALSVCTTLWCAPVYDVIITISLYSPTHTSAP